MHAARLCAGTPRPACVSCCRQENTCGLCHVGTPHTTKFSFRQRATAVGGAVDVSVDVCVCVCGVWVWCVYMCEGALATPSPAEVAAQLKDEVADLDAGLTGEYGQSPDDAAQFWMQSFYKHRDSRYLVPAATRLVAAGSEQAFDPTTEAQVTHRCCCRHKC